MDFNKLLLGYQEIEDLIKVAIKEKYITSYTSEYLNDFGIENFNIKHNEIFISKNRVDNKYFLFKLIMLYDNIDANRFMPFDISRLIDCGLFSENTYFNEISISKKHNEGIINDALIKMDNSDDFNYIVFVRGLFINIENIYNISILSSIYGYEDIELSRAIEHGDINEFKNILIKMKIEKLLIDNIRKQNLFNYEASNKFNKNNLNEIVEKYLITPTVKLLNRYKYDQANEYRIKRWFNITGDLLTVKNKKVCFSCQHRYNQNCFENDDCEYMLHRLVTLEDLFSSFEYSLPVFTSSFKPSFYLSNDIKIIDNIYTLIEKSEIAQYMKVNFKKLDCLPEPKSLKEAIYYRNKPEIISFRKIFKTWCESLQNMDDEATIKLVTRDFNRACKFNEQQYIKNNEARKTKNLIINILIDIIGAMLPPHLILPHSIKKHIKDKDEAIERKETEWFILTR